MTHSRSSFFLLLLLLALCLVGGLAWRLVLGSGREEPLLEQRVFAEPGEESEPFVRVQEPEPGKTAPRAGAGEIRLRIERLARVLPRRPASLGCRLVQGKRTIRAGIRFLAGTAALPLARRVQGRQLLQLELPGDAFLYRVLRVRPGQRAGLVVDHGVATHSRGTVVDDGGRPIQGAKVWLAGHELDTDAGGKFETGAIPAASGMPMVLRADGRAFIYRVLSKKQFEELHLHPIALAKGMELSVRLVGDRTTGGKGQVYVLPASSQRHTALLEYPFFMQAIEGGVPLDADGVARISGLPTGVTVRVLVLHPELLSLEQPEVELRRGKKLVVVVRARATTLLRGKVLDKDPSGKPIASAVLTSRASGAGLSLVGTDWMLPPVAYLRGVRQARSAKDGSYSLPLVLGADGVSLVTVEAEGRAGLEYDQVLPVWGKKRNFVLHPHGEEGEPILRLSFKKPSGRRFLLHLDLDGRSQGPFPWADTEVFTLRLSGRALVAVQPRIDGRLLELPSQLVRGPLDLVLDD